MMWGSNAHALGAAGVCDLVLALGGNTVSPLFQGTSVTNTVAEVQSVIDAARARNMRVVVNADHQNPSVGGFAGGARAWITQPAMVAMLNANTDVAMVSIEVETGDVDTEQDWLDGIEELITVLRDAGIQNVVKLGAPQGGRMLQFPLNRGEDALALDPIPNKMLLTWQCYWGEDGGTIGGQFYQGEAGFSDGLAGTLEALAAIAAAELPFLIGFDFEDNVGTTGEISLLSEAHDLDLDFQHWVLTGDTLFDNDLIDRFSSLNISNITPTGEAVQAVLLPLLTLVPYS
jgi:hypothetical protein